MTILTYAHKWIWEPTLSQILKLISVVAMVHIFPFTFPPHGYHGKLESYQGFVTILDKIIFEK